MQKQLNNTSNSIVSQADRIESDPALRFFEALYKQGLKEPLTDFI